MTVIEGIRAVLSFEEMMKHQKLYKMLGIRQFLQCIKKSGESPKTDHVRKGRVIRWGYQIEGQLTEEDGQNGKREYCNFSFNKVFHSKGIPADVEFGSWQFQLRPDKPYSTTSNLFAVIQELREQYRALSGIEESWMTISSLPFLGAEPLKNEHGQAVNDPIRGRYLTERHMAEVELYQDFLINLVKTRGSTMCAYVPLYQDQKTINELEGEPKAGHVHIDSPQFGFPTNNLQATFECDSFEQLRHLNDQFIILCPIFIALAPCMPYFRGKLTDIDSSFLACMEVMDDRSEQERDPQSPEYFPTLRHDLTTVYIDNSPANLPEYDDFDYRTRPELIELVKQQMASKGLQMDMKMTRYLANLVSRPLLHGYEAIEANQDFILQAIMTQRFGAVRMKVPDFEEGINWRLEIRSLEMQVLPDENAAFVLFLYLLTRVFNERPDLNLYIPLSLSHANFYRSDSRDAILKQRFHFRTNPESSGSAAIDELSCREVLFGKGAFRGLFAFIEDYTAAELGQQPAVGRLVACLREFLWQLVTGQKLTTAAWMRGFIGNHPLYKGDSVIPKRVSEDLLQRVEDISRGRVADPNFRPVFPDWTQEDFDELLAKQAV